MQREQLELRTPKQIMTNLNQDRQALVNSMISKIAATLEKEFRGQPLKMWIYESRQVVEQVFEHLQSELMAKEWKVEIVGAMDNQRDGTATELLLTPARNNYK